MSKVPAHFFDTALTYVNTSNPKVPRRGIISNVGDAATGSRVIEILVSEGLIKELENDYYKITEIGRDVSETCYQSFMDAKYFHGLSDAPDFLKIYNDAKNGVITEPPFFDEGYAQSQREIEIEQFENSQPFQESKTAIEDKLIKKILKQQRVEANKKAVETMHGKQVALPIPPVEKKFYQDLKFWISSAFLGILIYIGIKSFDIPVYKIFPSIAEHFNTNVIDT